MAIWILLLLQVEVAPPPGLNLSSPFRVLRGDVEVPAQVLEGRLLLPGPGEYRAEAVAPKDFPKIEFKDDGRSLTIGTSDRRTRRSKVWLSLSG